MNTTSNNNNIESKSQSVYVTVANGIVQDVFTDPNNREHRKAYNAQRDSMGLPELPAITEAEGIKVGDKVRHNKHEEVATVTAIREAFVNGCDGYRYLYTLDFGQSVKGPFDVELNGGEFLREAFTPCEA